MKKLILFSAIAAQVVLFCTVKAQVLNVNNNEQLYNQWCWAGCSKTILDYYGLNIEQCEIAEFVRTTATFHNFGTVDCCTDALQGCNYWNYLYGDNGSIEEILMHFGNLQSIGIPNVISQIEITDEIQNNRLFIIRWGWSTGGGHFVVGHGINGNNIYFMNPWFGEGLHIGSYNFMLNGYDGTSSAEHTWTHTSLITTDVSSVNETFNEKNISIYPNPFFEEATLSSNKLLNNATLTINNLYGQTVKEIKNITEKTVILNRDHLASGIYFIYLTQDNKTYAKKLVIAGN
jgi:hypothetical protein